MRPTSFARGRTQKETVLNINSKRALNTTHAKLPNTVFSHLTDSLIPTLNTPTILAQKLSGLPPLNYPYAFSDLPFGCKPGLVTPDSLITSEPHARDG